MAVVCNNLIMTSLRQSSYYSSFTIYFVFNRLIHLFVYIPTDCRFDFRLFHLHFDFIVLLENASGYAGTGHPQRDGAHVV